MKRILRSFVLVLLLLLAGGVFRGLILLARDVYTDEVTQKSDLPEEEGKEPGLQVADDAKESPVETEWVERELVMEDGGRFSFFTRFYGEGGVRLYRFRTSPLAPSIEGYAGPIPMVVVVDEAGKLVELDFEENEETPSFFAPVEQWGREQLVSREVSEVGFASVDTVTGATISAEAVRQTLLDAVELFFALK